MKNSLILTLSLIFFTLCSCGSQSGLDPKTVNDLVDGNQFTFMAKRANPTNYDVINVMNGMQGGSSRMLELDYGYSIIFKDNTMEVTLPYFGRSFAGSGYGDRDKQSYRFTSKDYSTSKSQNKKGNWVFSIQPKDVPHVRNIYVEVFKNGNAYVSIDANDRQPISYDGYIMKNEVSKK